MQRDFHKHSQYIKNSQESDFSFTRVIETSFEIIVTIFYSQLRLLLHSVNTALLFACFIHFIQQKLRSRFPFDSGLNVRKFPVTSATGLSEISRNKDNLARYTKILRNSVLWEFLSHLILVPESPKFPVDSNGSSEIQRFLDFLDTFPRNFLPFIPWLNGNA